MKKTILLSLFLFSFATAFAGDPTNIRGTGMGKSAVAASRGIESFGINPANIAIYDRGKLSVGLLPLSFSVRTDLINYKIYNDYFTGEDVNGERKQLLLDSTDIATIMDILPDVGKTRFNLDVMPVAVTFQNQLIGSFGFAVTEHIGVVNSLNKDYFRTILMGFPEEGVVYDYAGTGFSSWWYREYSFTYARQLPWTLGLVKDLYVGFSYKVIQGFGSLETDYFNSTFSSIPVLGPSWQLNGNFDFKLRHAGVDFMDESKGADFSATPDPAGKGTGLDFGLSTEVMSGLRVAASITDIGSITWDRNVRNNMGRGSVTITSPNEEAQLDSLKDIMKGEDVVGESYTMDLPRRFRVGVTMQSELIPWLKWLPGRLLLAADYTQGANENFGNTKKGRVSLGAEYRVIPLLPVRTGLTFGGDDVPRWALGFGLDFWVLAIDFGFENFGMLFNPEKFQMFQMGFGLRMRI